MLSKNLDYEVYSELDLLLGKLLRKIRIDDSEKLPSMHHL